MKTRKPFKSEINIMGRFSLSDIRVEYLGDNPFTYNTKVQNVINDIARRKKSQADKQGKEFYNAPIFALAKQPKAVDGRFYLTLYVDNYFNFWVSNHCPEVRKIAIPVPGVGVSGLLETSDNLLTIGKRSNKLITLPNVYDNFGGNLQPSNMQRLVESGESDGSPLFKMQTEELYEETGLPGNTIDKQLCLGIINRKRLGQHPVIIINTKTNLDSETLKQKFQRQSCREFDKIIFIPPSEITSWMKRSDISWTLYNCLKFYQSQESKI